VPVLRDGHIVEIVGVLADVTARRETEHALRESEERLRRMSESMDEVFFIASLDRTELYYVNHAFERLWGHTREEAYANPRLFLESIHPDDRVRCKAAIVAQWYDGFTNEARNLEYRVVRRDGSIRWVHTRTYPLPEPDGLVRRVAGINTDITERKEAELALNERTEQLERSLREKDVLLAEVHHRVKNNMQSIAGLVHLMAAQAQRRPLAETIAELERRIQAMALVHETLYRSANLADVDMQAYLERIGGALLAGVDTRERWIEVLVRAHGVVLDLESAVRCGFIVNELVTNALKHAFRGRERGRVEVAMRREGSSCVLRVSDDGAGMPADLDFESEQTLGLRLVQGLAGQMEGEAVRVGGEKSAIEVTFFADS
jgi:PAS domain S-box-containing protein